MTIKHLQLDRRSLLAIGGASAATIAAPWVARAQAKTIKIGMPTILSGRVATLGISSRNSAMMEIEKVNAAGGLAGRAIELVVRDSKGQAQEAARVARELVNTDGCEILIDAEASSGAFAVHEVARDLGVLTIHTNSETSSLSADPKSRIPNAFRCARMGIHDSVVGASYAAKIAKEKGLKRWATCSPDYAYGRDTTAEFTQYLKQFAPDVELVSEAWPKLAQPDYTESITKLLQANPQAIYSCVWGGDLSTFIDQANLYALFAKTAFFAVNMADYTVLTTVKNLPAGVHSGNRYIKTFPATPQNAAWAEAYRDKYREYPTNWAWQNALVVSFLAEAAKKAGSTETKKMADALRGLTVESPFGVDGKITMRAEDQTIVNYAIGWGTTISKEPYMPNVTAGDWAEIFRQETAWKKAKGFI